MNAPLFRKDAAADLQDRTLSCIPSVFGRLVYLSGLRDQDSGRYEHFGLAQVYGPAAAERALRRAHEENFSHRLCMSMREQYADLMLYFEGLGIDRTHLVRTWARRAPYRDVVPAGASEPERQLYVADMEILLELLLNESAPEERAGAVGVLAVSKAAG